MTRMNAYLTPPPAALRLTALLGSCGLHALALLLLFVWVTDKAMVQVPRLASLPVMTLAAPQSKPGLAAAAPTSKPQVAPTSKPSMPLKQSAPSRQALSPADSKPVTVPATARNDSPATTSDKHSATPAAAETPPTPAATEAVHEPLYSGGYLNNPKPAYPALSQELGETGTTRLRVHVSAQGLPLAVSLEQSSGFPRLDRAALNAVRDWKFLPARRGDEAIPYTFIIPVEFSLKKLRKP